MSGSCVGGIGLLKKMEIRASLRLLVDVYLLYFIISNLLTSFDISRSLHNKSI